MTDEERKQRICKNCDHFRDPDSGVKWGQCRAHSGGLVHVPAVAQAEQSWAWIGPCKFPTDWCGEWKARQ